MEAFQLIHRPIATLARDKGHVKDLQGEMRHSRVATTTDAYMQSLKEGLPAEEGVAKPAR